MEEALLDHLSEGCVEAEVVKIVIVQYRASMPLLILCLKGLIALGEGIQVDAY